MHISACCRHPSNEVSKNNPKLIKPTLEHPPGPLSKLSNNSYFSSPYKRTYCGWLRNPAPKGWLKPYSGMFTTYQLVMDFFHFLPSSVSVKPPMEVTLNLEIFELSAAAPAQRFSARGLRAQAGSGHVQLPEELEKPGRWWFFAGAAAIFVAEKREHHPK